MKFLMSTIAMSFLSSLVFAVQTPLLQSEAAQLRTETRLIISKGTTMLVFSGGQFSESNSFVSTCATNEKVCVLDVFQLAQGRERYLEINSILSLQKVTAMCTNGTGIVANLNTLRNQMQLRCNVSTVEEVQSLLGKYLTVQFPAKID